MGFRFTSAVVIHDNTVPAPARTANKTKAPIRLKREQKLEPFNAHPSDVFAEWGAWATQACIRF